MNEVTPKEMQCIGGLGCPAIYEITPEDMRCMVGACPAVYKIERLTPKEMQCESCIGGLGCPTMEKFEDEYLIIGKIRNPMGFGLEKKVGEGEVLISVPRLLIDKRGK